MPIIYKFDVLQRLKEAGFTTYKLRHEKLLAEAVIQKLRTGGTISFDNIAKICSLLNCQPGDLLEYTEE